VAFVGLLGIWRRRRGETSPCALKPDKGKNVEGWKRRGRERS